MNTENQSKKFIVVYGTLRKFGDRGKTYNFDRFGKNSQKFIKRFNLPGFNLYNLGYFPCVAESVNPTGISVELHEINGEIFELIQSMEAGAGYDEKIIKVENDGNEIEATIFCMPEARAAKFKKIESGDWCE